RKLSFGVIFHIFCIVWCLLLFKNKNTGLCKPNAQNANCWRPGILDTIKKYFLVFAFQIHRTPAYGVLGLKRLIAVSFLVTTTLACLNCLLLNNEKINKDCHFSKLHLQCVCKIV